VPLQLGDQAGVADAPQAQPAAAARTGSSMRNVEPRPSVDSRGPSARDTAARITLRGISDRMVGACDDRQLQIALAGDASVPQRHCSRGNAHFHEGLG
jgi:hypothetical protein